MLGTNKQLGGKPPSVRSKKTMDAKGDASTTTSAKTLSPIFACMNDSIHTNLMHARHQQATQRQLALGAVQQ